MENKLKGFVTHEGESYISFAEITKHAREMLKGNWLLSILVTIAYFVILIGVSVILQKIHIALGQIGTLIIAGPLALGFAVFSLSVSRKNELEFGQLFAGFSNFLTAFLANLLMAIFVILWMLLLIVPGIIKGLAYSMTYFILVDNKDMKALEAITKSKEMMQGHKFELFCLQLRFVGWGMLAILTLGIGFLWLFPYMQVSYAKFYDDLKATQK
ncbi:MAG: DUF975 family protein [Candidatus Marinimicrobia bacterium]|nr:DUF975 family protein [Candidatus Neomarinimicrobiota bacterium]